MRRFLWVMLALPTMASAQDDHQCFRLNPNEQPEASAAACSELIAAPPDNAHLLAEAYSNRGVARRELGALADSVADLEQAVQLSGNANSMRMLAWSYREMNRPDKAEEIYTRVLESDDHWQGWLSRCVSRQDQKKYLMAAEDCEEALQRNPDSLDALYFTARAYNFLGDGMRALVPAQKAASLAPDQPRLLVELTWATYLAGDRARAAEMAQQGLQKHPGHPGLISFLDQTQ